VEVGGMQRNGEEEEENGFHAGGRPEEYAI